MGLTIHYSFKAKPELEVEARGMVERMRQFALDLPFEAVGEVNHFTGEQCDYEKVDRESPHRWLLIQARESVILQRKRLPCQGSGKRYSEIWADVKPAEVIAFSVDVGLGCEEMNLGLCKYPASVETSAGAVPSKVGAGWHWRSFCKTQYASEPAAGGVANFLRCHIGVITLLDKINKIPGVRVSVNDEGKYGRSNYSDDWREAREQGREPTYRPHAGRYSPAELVKEIGEWNEMIAGFAGVLKDAAGDGLEAPILNFSDFEQLEFRGHKSREIAPFLATMKTVAKKIAAAHPSKE